MLKIFPVYSKQSYASDHEHYFSTTTTVGLCCAVRVWSRPWLVDK